MIFLDFLSKKIFLLSFTEFELFISHNSIVKISEKIEQESVSKLPTLQISA